MLFLGTDGLSSGCHAVTLTPSYLPDCGPSFSLQVFASPARWEQSVTQHVWTVEVFKKAVRSLLIYLPLLLIPLVFLVLLSNIQFMFKKILSGKIAIQFMDLLNLFLACFSCFHSRQK